MHRPLSDAVTTFMPELVPATVPIRVAFFCAWCGVKLAAIPDEPQEYAEHYYHPSCLGAYLSTG